MNAPGSTMDAPAPAARSALVSVLGWLAVFCGALSVLETFTQAALYDVMSEAPVESFDPAMQEGLSRVTSVVTVLNLVVSLFLMYAGYALWQRRNWARVTFIVLFALGIAANLLWVAAAALFGSLLAQGGVAVGAVMVVLSVAFSLAVAALFYWLIRRLRSPAVRSEFV